MRRFGLVALVLVFSVLTAAPAAHADKRVALVIGNGDYGKVGKLVNPTRDASAVEALLRAVGFDVVEAKRDLGAAAMRRALRDFSFRVRDADIAVVFYAGHGIEVNGTNYLIPVDATLERDIDVEDETVPLERVTQVLEQAKRLRLVILDACRDNPFVRSMKRMVTGRSIGRGLAKVDVFTTDTLIAFAAKAGSTAADGEGTNSPYTIALVKHLATPGLDLRLALGRVRDEVLKSTANRQEPFVYGSLGGAEISLVAAPAFPPAVTFPPPPTQRLSEAAEAWDRAKDAANVAVLESYAVRYKDTFYAELARARIDELKKQQVAVASPPPAATAAAPAQVKPAVEIAPVPTPAPGPVFRDCPDCPEMVVVPAGSFMMGSDPADIAALDKQTSDHHDREGPQHKVTIAGSFAVGKFEVTFAEWETCVTDGGCAKRKSPSDEGWGKSRRPVITVSWHDAKSYVEWLSRHTGKTYRLLTEAEWEYAARAGTSTAYSWGNGIGVNRANCAGCGSEWDYKQTGPVGSFTANAFGLHDMHGNVSEWVEDCWHSNYQGAPTDGSAWTTSCTESRRVVRGGSWNGGPLTLRAAYRYWGTIDYRLYGLGFRLARTLDP